MGSKPTPYDLILDGLGVGVMVQDRHGDIVFANAQAAQMSGFSDVAEMLATPISAVQGRFQLCDRDGVSLSFDKLPGRLVLAGEGPNHVLIRYHVRNISDERWADLHANPILDDDGAVRYVVTLFRDVRRSGAVWRRAESLTRGTRRSSRRSATP